MKPYLVFMAGPDSIENIRELVDPVKQYFRGVCALLHDCDEFSPEAEYLLKVNTELGGGNIIFGNFVKRHDHSRNRILYETGMKEGDWFIQTDVLERPKAEFLEKVPEIIDSNPELGCLFFYAKPFLVRYEESLFYKGNPHESLSGIKGWRVEYSQYEPNEKIVRENVRSLKRTNPFGWCSHYLRYYLYPDTNQCLLGNENRGDVMKIFAEREIIRKKFIFALNLYGYEKNPDGAAKILKERADDPTVKDCINKEKILNDFYRLWVLNDMSIKDSHSLEAWQNMPKF